MLTKIRVAIILVLVAGLAVSAYSGYRLYTAPPPPHAPEVAQVTGTTADGWQQLTYRGVDVEVPPDWQRLDDSGCDGGGPEHWGPAATDPCAPDLGLWYENEATFDAAVGPGVHKAPPSVNLPDGGWAGYVTRGSVVVDVAGADQNVVRRILQSVSEVL